MPKNFFMSPRSFISNSSAKVRCKAEMCDGSGPVIKRSSM